jgi:hypothetical protein
MLRECQEGCDILLEVGLPRCVVCCGTDARQRWRTSAVRWMPWLERPFPINNVRILHPPPNAICVYCVLVEIQGH